MEENKSRKFKFSTILVIFLIIILLLEICITYYKLGESYVTIDKLNKEIRESKNADTDEINTYSNFVKKIEKSVKALEEKNNEKITKEVDIFDGDEGKRYGYAGAYVDEQNNAYIKIKEDTTLYNKYGKEYKVDENVLNVYVAYYANGGFSDFIFIKRDGTVDTVSTANMEEIKCEKLENVKNAVTVLPCAMEDKDYGVGEYQYLIIDINGNVVNKK